MSDNEDTKRSSVDAGRGSRRGSRRSRRSRRDSSSSSSSSFGDGYRRGRRGFRYMGGGAVPGSYGFGPTAGGYGYGQPSYSQSQYGYQQQTTMGYYGGGRRHGHGRRSRRGHGHSRRHGRHGHHGFGGHHGGGQWFTGAGYPGMGYTPAGTFIQQPGYQHAFGMGDPVGAWYQAPSQQTVASTAYTGGVTYTQGTTQGTVLGAAGTQM